MFSGILSAFSYESANNQRENKVLKMEAESGGCCHKLKSRSNYGMLEEAR
jgi:hypothetical protein